LSKYFLSEPPMTTHASPFTPLDNEYPLGEPEILRYRRDGHILLRSVASSSSIDTYRPLIREVVHEKARQNDSQGRIEDYSSLFTQVTNVWRLNEHIRRFVFARRFAQIAADLMGVDAVRLYHDQALFKPAGGRATPWHQDQFYWPLDTQQMITMWMPLIDVTEEMGTMLFASGSHLDGPLVDRSISEESDAEFAGLVEEKHYPVAGYTLNAGDATFHSGWTVHAAHPNRSTIQREVITVIYYADGARILEPDSEFRRVDMEVFHPGQNPGDVAASPLNPLLYHRS
jgi:ectoine hydroxylase-related dioxygenase (phytanoyl-CoA dioxygenase family)